MRFLALYLFANAVDERVNPLLKNVKVGLAKESRVPDMNNIFDHLIDVIDCERNKKYNGISCHDIKITVVYCNVDGLVVAARELGDGLGNISKVSGRYRVIIFIGLGVEYD